VSSSSPHPNEGVASLETLGRAECLNLLATAQVGRVALLIEGRPEILPVNYALDGDAVLFRTAEGSVLTKAALTEVAFEVDHVDGSTRPAGACSSKARQTTSVTPSIKHRNGSAGWR
jgi:nitroimidazol reductase NimA-like FMN-containing flavoprotein (pyridoxamine 5'-phosphate oxidase superfamily)